jgi:hypothetical protein
MYRNEGESMLLRKLAHFSLVIQLVRLNWVNYDDIDDSRKRRITNILVLDLDHRALLIDHHSRINSRSPQ